jgi:diadenosine tetraphosphate (Ap4A) HIT family hydrolase
LCFTAAMTACRTCLLSAIRDAGKAPPWDSIMRTPGWDVVHAFGTSVVGWTVLVARRHITALADMTDTEALELGPLIKSVSRALHRTIGCQKTYVVRSPSIRTIRTCTFM